MHFILSVMSVLMTTYLWYLNSQNKSIYGTKRIQNTNHRKLKSRFFARSSFDSCCELLSFKTRIIIET